MTNDAPPAGEITKFLRNWKSANDGSGDALFNLVYEELRRQAHLFLRKERAEHTLQTTALVNEAYLKLAHGKMFSWESRAQFFAVAAKMMRQILIDYARQRHRVKRGGAKENLQLEAAMTITASGVNFDLLDLDQALNRLAENDEYLARIVELRFFSGLDVPETAKVLGVSESTVKRDWAMAKSWLHSELTK
ncbi:MAG: sigma-70 family RNA polymerase sigma factor [Acidobacteria bacterium]|nr:sigma-70 family RNA polymerase sigma factor [Acidobacteriota bacterium]